MIQGRLIICIANSWDYDPTSKHQIMKILAEHNTILWINYHGSRRPVVNRSDLKDSYSALRRVARGLRPVSPSIAQLTPMVLPGARNPLLQWLHQRMLIMQIRRAVRALNKDKYKPIQVWSFAPDVPYLVGAFEEECFLYYCVDEYTQFDGFASEHIASSEREQMKRADIVITSSEPLLEAKSAVRPDAQLVRHGVDYDHFAAAWHSSPPRLADLAAIPRPIFGFFGLVHHWVDRALIAEVARRRPLYSFVLIGDCKVDVSELARLDNVFLLGRRAYEDLPAYCASFDAAMLLFTRTAMTRNINPVKMYEYLAAGLPVVSTPLPEARRFAGPIRIAESPGEFAEACDRVSENLGHVDRKAISRLVASETWRAKVEHLSDIVMTGLCPLLQAASKPRSEVGPWTWSVPESVATTH
jgi:glycosyltransferase involved in cell wall biosynthesis